DAKGLVVAPGLIDLAARLREPGHAYKATLESEMDAAVAGGVTSLACPPDTQPPLDEPGLVDMLRRRAKALARARLSGGRAHGEARWRTAHRDVGAGPRWLRRFLAVQRADHRYAGAVARAAVRGDLRLPGLAARRGQVVVARGRGARRRGGDAPRPRRHPGLHRDHRARHHAAAGALHRRARPLLPP